MSTPHGTFQLVIGFVGAALLIALVGVISLAAMDREIPGILETLAVSALGVIGALLAKTPNDSTPQAVQVVNDGGRPVPVEQTP